MFRTFVEATQLASHRVRRIILLDDKNSLQPDLGCQMFRDHEGLVRMAEAGIGLGGGGLEIQVAAEDEALVPTEARAVG